MKKIIKKRVLECVMEQQKNIEYGKMFPRDFDLRLSKSIELREKYKEYRLKINRSFSLVGCKIPKLQKFLFLIRVR